MVCSERVMRDDWSRDGSWNREARRVRLLAAELGATVDAEALVLYDVHDLQAVRWRLQQALGQGRRLTMRGRTLYPQSPIVFKHR